MITFKVMLFSLTVILSTVSCTANSKESKKIDSPTIPTSQIKEQLQEATENKQNVLMVVSDKTSSTKSINEQGVMSGRFDKLSSQIVLVETTTKVVQSGCAPSGDTPTCN